MLLCSCRKMCTFAAKIAQNRLTNMNFVLPVWIDYWGYDSPHDWAWWRKQIVYFMDHLLTEETVEYVI